MPERRFESAIARLVATAAVTIGGGAALSQTIFAKDHSSNTNQELRLDEIPNG